MRILSILLFMFIFVTCVTAQGKLEKAAYEFAFTDTVDTDGDSLETHAGVNMGSFFSNWYVMSMGTDADIEISADSNFAVGNVFILLADETYTSARKDVRNYPDYYFRAVTGTAIVRFIVEGR